jgi:hypothetical protein
MSFESTEKLIRDLKEIRKFCDSTKCDDKSETDMVTAVGDVVSGVASILICMKKARYGRLPSLREFNEDNP